MPILNDHLYIKEYKAKKIMTINDIEANIKDGNNTNGYIINLKPNQIELLIINNYQMDFVMENLSNKIIISIYDLDFDQVFIL